MGCPLLEIEHVVLAQDEYNELSGLMSSVSCSTRDCVPVQSGRILNLCLREGKNVCSSLLPRGECLSSCVFPTYQWARP